jgi:hypothetical protein
VIILPMSYEIGVAMLITSFGMVLILAGWAVGLGPILYCLHREAVAKSARNVAADFATRAVTPPKCSHCGEIVDDVYFMFTSHAGQYNADAQLQAS